MHRYSYGKLSAPKNVRTDFLERVRNFTMRLFFSFGMAAAATAMPMTITANNASTYMYAVSDAAHDQSAEIEKLKRQLQTATRDLHEYKAQLFRSSHPQDLAKIASLNQQIDDRDAINEKMNETLRSLEKDMLQARKQASTLEVTADALSAMIMAQRSVNDNQQKEHLVRVRTLNDELQTAMALLEKEQQLTSKMDKQLNETQQTLAAYEKRINELEIGHAEALAATTAIESKLMDADQQHSDAHQELHFALNDLEQAKNALYAEVFQTKAELEKRMASEENLKQNLAEATQRLQEQQERFAQLETELQNALFESSMLKFQMADVQAKQSHLDEQNTAHLNHLTMSLDYARDLENSQTALQENVQNNLSKHFHDNESLKRTVQEKEEVLTTAMLFYEATLKEYQAREEILHASLMQSQSRGCQLETELESALNTHNEEQQRLEKLKADKEHFQTMFEKRHFDAIALEEQFRNDHLNLKNDLNEKEQAFSEAALHYLSMLDDYRQQVEAVEARLSQAEKEGTSLQARLESSLTAHDQERTHIQSLHDEKEQLRSSFEKYQAEAIELQEKWNFEQASLQNALEEKEAAFSGVAYHYLSMLEDFRHQVDVTEEKLSQSEQVRSKLEEKLASYVPGHEEEKTALQNTLQTEIDRLNAVIEQLQTSALLAQEGLQNEIIGLKSILHLKEEALTAADQQVHGIRTDHHSQIETLEQHLSEIATKYSQLQDKHESSFEEIAKEKQLFESMKMEIQDLQIALEKQQSEALASTEQLKSEISSLQNHLREKEETLSLTTEDTLSLKTALLAEKASLEERLAEAEKIHSTHQQQLETSNLAYDEEKKNSSRLLIDIESARQTISQFKEAAEEQLSNIASKELEIKALQESTELLKAKFLAEKEELQAKLDEQLLHSETMQSQINDMLSKQAVSSEQNTELERQLQQLNSSLEEKDHQMLETLSQLQSLKLKAAELNDQLGAASMESSHAEERIAALRAALATTQTEQTSQQLSLTLAIDKLHAQANEDKATIAQLSEDIEQLALNNQYKADARRQEFDQQMHSFSALVERQDRALADAGETLQQAQLLSEHLQRENEHLKRTLLIHSETAERKLNGELGDAWEGKHEIAEHEALAPLIIGPKSSGNVQGIFRVPGK